MTDGATHGRWIRHRDRIVLLGVQEEPGSAAAQFAGRSQTPLVTPPSIREGETEVSQPGSQQQRRTTRRALSLERVQDLIEKHNKSSVSPDLLLCLIWKESSFDPKLSMTPKSSATGLMQMTRAAVHDVNRNSPRGVHFRHREMTDPAKNIECGTRYLELRIKRASSLRAGLEGYGGRRGYADDILSCESCIQTVREAVGRLGYGSMDPRTCLQGIHK